MSDSAIIIVDSRFRDRILYPDANSYVFTFDAPLRGVDTVELVHVIYDKNTPDAYVNLSLAELDPRRVVSNSQAATRALVQLPLAGRHDENCTFSGQSDFRIVRRFNPAVAKLSRLTVRWTRPDGSPYPTRDHLIRLHVRLTCPRRAVA